MKTIFIPIFMILSSVANASDLKDTVRTENCEIMTLHNCMEYALKSSTKYEILKLDNADIRLERRDAILRTFTPSVSVGSYAYTNFGRAVDPETNTYINTTSFNNAYSIDASLTLFNGFESLNNIKISQTAVKIGMSEKKKLENELCLAVMEAYYNVMYYSEMVDVLKEQVEVSKTNVQLLKKQYELGQKGYPDVAQTEADLADREFQLTTSINNRDDAMLTLKSVMLWPIDDMLIIDRTMAETDFLSIVDEHDSVDEIIDYAIETQPSAKIADGNLNKARLNLKTAKWKFLPTLSISGGWSTSYYSYPGKSDYKAPTFYSQWHNNAGEYIQLNLSFPIYNRLSHFTNLSKKENEFKRAEARYKQTIHDIESEVSRAVQDKKRALKSLILAIKRKNAQRETYLLHEKKMKQGMVSPVEFQTITNSYLNARAEEINALLKYYLKRSVVKYYKGTSYIDQQ